MNRPMVVQPPPLLMPNVAKFSPALLPKWRNGKAKVLGGTSNATVLCLGNSLTLGAGPVSGSSRRSVTPWPARVANRLNSYGITAHANSAFAEGGVGISTLVSGYDGRLSIGASWTAIPGATYRTIGGQLLQASTATNKFSWTVAGVDTFEVWTVRIGAAGTVALDIDSGTATNVDENGANALIKTTISAGSVGSRTLNLTYVSGGTVYLVGVVAYDSSAKTVHFINGGFSGAEASFYNANSFQWQGLSAIGYIAPDLTIIDFGTNEVLNGTSALTFKTNMQPIITAALLTGDVILVAPMPYDTAYNGNSSLANQMAMNAAVYDLAQTNNCVLLDQFGRFGSYATANALGWFAADGVHCLAPGYADYADLVSRVLIAA